MNVALTRVRRMSGSSHVKRHHGVGAVGYAVVQPDQRIPRNDFFQPQRKFRVRFRFVRCALHLLPCVVWFSRGLFLFHKKGKGFPYSIPSVGPGADPGVQAVSLQVTVSHPPGGRLRLLSARPAVTSPAAEHHRPLAGTKLYCLVTEARGCKQLALGCYAALPEQDLNLRPTDRKPKCLTRYTTAPPITVF